MSNNNERPNFLFSSSGDCWVKVEADCSGWDDMPWEPASDFIDYCTITAKCGNFRGQVEKVTIEAHSVHKLLRELRVAYTANSGQVSFSVLEDQLRLTLEIDHLGHVSIDGILSDPYGWSLKFELGSDQTYLPGLIDQVEKFCAAFPYTEPEGP
jgi:hypothetical protein